MATQWDVQNAKSQQSQTVGTVVTSVGAAANILIPKLATVPVAPAPSNILGTLVETISAFAMAGFNFLKTSAAQKDATKKQTQQTAATSYINDILNKLSKGGSYLITEKGMNPQDPNFEPTLQKLLYPLIGYNRNCDIDLRGPAPLSPLWFQITDGGTQIQNISSEVRLPPNLLIYWISRCQAIHSQWISDYTDLVIHQQHQQLLSQDQQSLSKANLISGVVFGGLGFILLVSMVYYSTKVKR